MPRDSQTRTNLSPEPGLWPAALERWLAGPKPCPEPSPKHPEHEAKPGRRAVERSHS